MGGVEDIQVKKAASHLGLVPCIERIFFFAEARGFELDLSDESVRRQSLTLVRFRV